MRPGLIASARRPRSPTPASCRNSTMHGASAWPSAGLVSLRSTRIAGNILPLPRPMAPPNPMPNEGNAMRFVSYIVDGHASWGALTDEDNIVDLKARGFGGTLRMAVAAERLGEVRAVIEVLAPDHALADVELALPDAGKVLAVGANYSAHAAEMSRDVGSDPQFFLRLPGSLVPHGAPIVKPRASDHLDYEGELAVIIGKRGRHIPLESAMAHVAGYSCFNDGTIRDYQKVSLPVGKTSRRADRWARGWCRPTPSPSRSSSRPVSTAIGASMITPRT